MHVRVTVVALVCLSSSFAHGQTCGGDERWAVKVAADAGATQVNLASPVVMDMHDLVRVARPSLPSDDVTRVATERVVRVVDGHLVKFKQETGKKGDSDFHLVISDGTGLFSAGGSGAASEHSVIAEIIDPNCIGGRDGTVSGQSFVKAQLDAVRAKFVQQFPNIHSGWNDADAIAVRITAITFFDRPHGQVGRALNGLELHPVLDIEFNPGPPVAPGAAPVSPPFDNPGFESGSAPWTATVQVVTASANEPAHSGTRKAWLGGWGQVHTDKLSRSITLPAAAHTIALSFFLHIDTEENGDQAFDKLRVHVRNSSGTLLKTIKTYSNQNAAPGFTLQTLDLTEYKGRTIVIEFASQEDKALLTSFVLDDFALKIEP